MNRVLIEKMVTYLPFSQHIIGNFDMTFNLLEVILEEKVTYNIVRNRKNNNLNTDSNQISGFTLGKASLGWDFVCGDTMMDLTPLIEIKLGPVKESELSDYFDGGDKRIFIDYFCSFFMPFEVDYKIQLKSNNNKEFKLPVSSEVIVMGFDTYI